MLRQAACTGGFGRFFCIQDDREASCLAMPQNHSAPKVYANWRGQESKYEQVLISVNNEHYIFDVTVLQGKTLYFFKIYVNYVRYASATFRGGGGGGS